MSSLVTPKAATASDQLINLWLGGKSRHTADYYRRSARRFQEFVGKPLHLVTFAEVQAFASHLESLELAASSQLSNPCCRLAIKLAFFQPMWERRSSPHLLLTLYQNGFSPSLKSR